MKIPISIVNGVDVKIPSRAHSTDAGLDFFVPNNFKPMILHAHESIKIPSGIKIEIPYSYMGVFLNKSKLGSMGLMIGAQVIDTFYSDQVYLDVHNVTNHDIEITPGMKIAQLILVPIIYAEPIQVTDDELYSALKQNEVRGANGFGSSGI